MQSYLHISSKMNSKCLSAIEQLGQGQGSSDADEATCPYRMVDQLLVRVRQRQGQRSSESAVAIHTSGLQARDRDGSAVIPHSKSGPASTLAVAAPPPPPPQPPGLPPAVANNVWEE
ncbi:unnamed protein product [Amoebophrya sp. A120]|nr:unnamed protein product [Amoebophrya sp. A120]|eukprot:GSA120T00019704001.1